MVCFLYLVDLKVSNHHDSKTLIYGSITRMKKQNPHAASRAEQGGGAMLTYVHYIIPPHQHSNHQSFSENWTKYM